MIKEILPSQISDTVNRILLLIWNVVEIVFEASGNHRINSVALCCRCCYNFRLFSVVVVIGYNKNNNNQYKRLRSAEGACPQVRKRKNQRRPSGYYLLIISINYYQMIIFHNGPKRVSTNQNRLNGFGPPKNYNFQKYFYSSEGPYPYASNKPSMTIR